MNTVKKALAVLVIIVMMFSMSASAFALTNAEDGSTSTTNDGTITVINPTAGETYKAYKIADLKTDGKGNYLYTVTPEWKDAVKFFISKLSDPTAISFNDTDSTKSDYLQIIGLTDAIATEFAGIVAQHAANMKDVPAAAAKAISPTKTTSREVEFEGLDYGYYFVESSLGTSVTLTNADHNAKVMDKNEGPTWDNEPPPGDNPPPDPDYKNGDPNPGKVILMKDKNGVEYKVKENSVNYGDTVYFSTAVNATEFVLTKTVTHYYINDEIVEGFGPITIDSVTVKDVDGTVHTLVEYDANNNGVNDANEYQIKFDSTKRKFEVVLPFGHQYGANAVIDVRYHATINADGTNVVLAGNGNLNTANYTYTLEKDSNGNTVTYDPENPTTPPTDPYSPPSPPDDPNPPTDHPSYDPTNEKHTWTYVYALGIEKVDEKGNRIDGAEFSVTVKDADGNDVDIYGIKEADGVYRYCKSTDTGAVKKFTTKDGILIIKGVAAGVYSVKEEKAPDGFNLLTKPSVMTATIGEKYGTEIYTYIDTNGNALAAKDGTEDTSKTKTYDTKVNIVPMVIINKSGVQLPATGGIGTTIFYALGGFLALCAGILLVTKKRMNAID